MITGFVSMSERKRASSVFVERLRSCEFDFGSAFNFRNQVMIVRVKPLFHGQGFDVTCISLIPAGHGKIGFKRRKIERAYIFQAR